MCSPTLTQAAVILVRFRRRRRLECQEGEELDPVLPMNSYQKVLGLFGTQVRSLVHGKASVHTHPLEPKWLLRPGLNGTGRAGPAGMVTVHSGNELACRSASPVPRGGGAGRREEEEGIKNRIGGATSAGVFGEGNEKHVREGQQLKR